MEVERTGLQDYFALLRRRRRSMFTTFAVVSLLTVFGTLLLQDQYQSTATIAIERPEIPDDMVRTTVATYDTDLRIFRIRDRVLNAPDIEQLIEEFGLYEDIVAESSVGAAVGEFRDDVEVITIQAREDLAVKNQGETIAFNLSYFGETPAKAVQVAARLADSFLEENRSSRNQSVEETLKFFQEDADRLALKITETESKLADFKERNSGALPESANINTQMLQRAEGDLDEIQREIRERREQRQIHQAELAKVSPNAPISSATGETFLEGADRLKFLQQQLVELSSKYSPEHPDVVRTQREIQLLSGGRTSSAAESIRAELDYSRLEFESLRQRYTSDHPDIIKLRRKISSLESQLASINSMPRPSGTTRPDNPAYITLLVQIDAASAEINALESRSRVLRDRISRYESLLLQSPQVEREFLSLQREYDQAVKDFNEVREKQTKAQQARQLEVSEKGERYVLQRTPYEPKSAAFPNRLAIMILGIVFASGCALGAAVVSEGLDATVRGTRDLKLITGMPAIAVIPVLESDAEKQKRTLAWSASVVGLATVITYMITMQIL